MKKKFMLRAFSLMEMMIVLLIVAIIAAASAPMISKKMMRQTGTGDSPWVFTGTGNSIAYNMDGRRDTVYIGRGDETFGANGNYLDQRVTRVNTVPLVVHTNIAPDDPISPAIAFADGNNNIMGYLGMTRGTTFFSNIIPRDNLGGDDGATIVGTNIDAKVNNSHLFNKIIYGYNINYRLSDADATARNHDILVGSNIGINNHPILARTTDTANANIIIGNGIEGSSSRILNTTIIGNGGRINGEGNIDRSVAIGTDAVLNAPGQGMIAFGSRASVSGTHSLAIGDSATTTANNSIAIGAGSQTSAQSAIAIGTNAIANHVNAITIGTHTAGSGIGATNDNAIAIGTNAQASALNSIAIGATDNINNAGAIAANNHAIAIGTNARAVNENSVAIGRDAQTTGGNQIVLGSDGKAGRISSPTVIIPGDLEVHGNFIFQGTNFTNVANGYITTSDIRLKNVGEKLTSGLEDIKKLEFFNYTFKDDKEQKPHVGVMAQDLQKVFPTSVTEGSDGYLRIRWDEMFYAALNAIKELDNKITEIKTKVASYFDRVAKLEAQIDEQQKTIEELQKQNAEFKKRLAKIEKRGVNKGAGVNRAVQAIKTPSKQAESEAE